ncbi:purine-nucleoside phosphorylase [Lachnospiraceae bacterium ZAX-1]
MKAEYTKLLKCYESYSQRINFKPEIAVILGSGLGAYAEKIKIEATLDYKDIEGFPVSTIPGHAGRFVFGYEGEVPIVVMQGRVHYYEGYNMTDVVLPTRLMQMMGAKVLFLTNAAGGVNETFQAGDLMLIKDHISSYIPSPLIGENIEELGTRFPDMSTVYDPFLCTIIKETAEAIKIKLQEGIYLQFSGPAYETPAEIRMSRMLGADAVGMSTVCEAIAANHAGMKICGISCITNMASGILQQPLAHKEVQETADRVAAQFEMLVRNSLLHIHNSL